MPLESHSADRRRPPGQKQGIDFAIVGAPKAGTSSLFNWLNAHPQLQGSVPKETFFFMDRDHPLTLHLRRTGLRTVHDDGVDGYERFFPEPAGNRLRFEATTHHFYQQTALHYLGAMESEPLIVMVLRRPADRIRSSFQFTQENLGGISRELTFDRYVEHLLHGEPDELDRFFVHASSLHIAKRELELSRYADWLSTWEQRVGRERLGILLMEEATSAPRKVMQQLSRRLGIDPGFWDGFHFAVHNRSVRIRNQRLHRLALSGSRYLPLRSLKLRLKRVYLRFQQTKAPHQDTARRGMAMLDEYFAPHNRALTEQFGLDLSSWNHGSAALSTGA